MVPMPKLKTHRWAGIDRAVLDINAAALPNFAILDGLVGTEASKGRPSPPA